MVYIWCPCRLRRRQQAIHLSLKVSTSRLLNAPRKQCLAHVQCQQGLRSSGRIGRSISNISMPATTTITRRSRAAAAHRCTVTAPSAACPSEPAHGSGL